MKFMNLPEEYSGKESRYYILPIEYEGNMTGGKGASQGSQKIIEASYQLEYYDEIFGIEPFERGIHLLEPLRLNDCKPEDAMLKISEEISKHEKFVLSLGGDHSVTIGVLKGLEKKHNSFSVIVFDAHADLFYSWNGSRYNHRCVTRYASINHKVGVIGLRSLDKEEASLIEKSESIEAYYNHENKSNISKIVDNMDENVYISIDVDVFDPAFIRCTGTPEPGGFSWDSMIESLKHIFETKNVIGVDIVEFSPREDSTVEAYSLAKLIYKIIAMKEKVTNEKSK
ncbi:MAG: agmatinase [Nanoarchaeota archaeon]